MRIRKNYYNFSFGQYCGVIVDEAVMKKIAKLQYETYDKLLGILENSENVYVSNWGISEEPSDISQENRIFNYIDDGYKSDLGYRFPLLKEIFKIEKVKNLYRVDGTNMNSRNLAEQEHMKHLLKGESIKSE